MSAEPDELGRSLLLAAREDRPSARFERTLMLKLGVGSGLAFSSTPAMRLVAGGREKSPHETVSDSSLCGQRTLVLEVQAAAPAGTAAASASVSVTLGAMLKAAGLGMLAGFVSLGAAQAALHPADSAGGTVVAAALGATGTVSSGRTPRPPLRVPLLPAESSEPTDDSARAELAARGIRAVGGPRARLLGARSAGVGVHPQARADASARPSPEKDSLAMEVALLRRARSTLEAGDGPGALALLDEYTRQRKTTFLVPEATLLRAKALAASGQNVAAARVAREFMGSHAGARQEAAIEAFTRGADVAP